jgi:hypothetical protein
MKELVRHKYTRTIYPEHPCMFDYDRQYNKPSNISRPGGYPGRGGYTGTVFNVAFTTALLMAAQESA